MKPFALHFNRVEAETLAQEVRLPEGFFFGTATAGYQVEGGYNGRGQPQTNWALKERAQQVEPTGSACRFFDYAEADLTTMERMGLTMFRMSVEWARIQPDCAKGEHPLTPPPFDEAAVERYARLLASAQSHGLEPCVTLHHFVHPLWAGIDVWLHHERSQQLFAAYVERVVRRLGELLVAAGKKPVRFWITLNEINLLPGACYLDGRFPHGARTSVSNMLTASENLFCAHCLAYDTIHRVYREHGWPEPLVSTNTNSSVLYHLDKFFIDLLSAKEAGIGRHEVQPYLDERAQRWRQHIAQLAPPKIKAAWLRTGVEKLVGRRLATLHRAQRFGRLLDAIYASPNARKLDFLSFDYYDPFPRSQLGLASPGERWLGGRPNLVADFSRQTLNPRGMRQLMHAYADGHAHKPILIAENGMCHRFASGRVLPRPDGATRDRFLRAYVYEVFAALAEGLPLIGYLHWAFCDNYEWGSFGPRFGLFAVDFQHGARRSHLDAFGQNAGGTYAALVQAARAGSAKDLWHALISESAPQVSVAAD